MALLFSLNSYVHSLREPLAMLKVRDALMSFLGGSETMWDVALGVIIGGIILGILYFFVAIVAELFFGNKTR